MTPSSSTPVSLAIRSRRPILEMECLCKKLRSGQGSQLEASRGLKRIIKSLRRKCKFMRRDTTCTRRITPLFKNTSPQRCYLYTTSNSVPKTISNLGTLLSSSA
jgi:hypothetical protein